jgi:hypothetical protein
MASVLEFAFWTCLVLEIVLVVVYVYNEYIVPWIWKKEDEFWEEYDRMRNAQDE